MAEMFETFTLAGTPLGLLDRDTVHRTGRWHKSTQVFVYDYQGRLLMQQRSAHKDLYPNLWDNSVGEHLQPGEGFRQAAHRGLVEELGITIAHLTPVPGIHRFVYCMHQVRDREIQKAFTGVYGGPVTIDVEEVQAVRYVGLEELKRWVIEQPRDFTPWFVNALHVLSVLD